MTKNELKLMANRIKERRLELSFTQEEIAEIIELSYSSYTKIENAFQTPSLDTIIAISKTLNISLDYLIFGNIENKPSSSSNIDVINSILQLADADKLKHTANILTKISDNI